MESELFLSLQHLGHSFWLFYHPSQANSSVTLRGQASEENPSWMGTGNFECLTVRHGKETITSFQFTNSNYIFVSSNRIIVSRNSDKV